eukprot:gb/GECG01007134.1/.p1 GENE.gb/GECG01007134.1/~~gb/GECG01007134.1/.p1  ORF type:complete len:115 (+),score=5.81 gb/GECG01007134.1/:1-345(+)
MRRISNAAQYPTRYVLPSVYLESSIVTSSGTYPPPFALLSVYSYRHGNYIYRMHDKESTMAHLSEAKQRVKKAVMDRCNFVLSTTTQLLLFEQTRVLCRLPLGDERTHPGETTP